MSLVQNAPKKAPRDNASRAHRASIVPSITATTRQRRKGDRCHASYVSVKYCSFVPSLHRGVIDATKQRLNMSQTNNCAEESASERRVEGMLNIVPTIPGVSHQQSDKLDRNRGNVSSSSEYCSNDSGGKPSPGDEA